MANETPSIADRASAVLIAGATPELREVLERRIEQLDRQIAELRARRAELEAEEPG